MSIIDKVRDAARFTRSAALAQRHGPDVATHIGRIVKQPVVRYIHGRTGSADRIGKPRRKSLHGLEDPAGTQWPPGPWVNILPDETLHAHLVEQVIDTSIIGSKPGTRSRQPSRRDFHPLGFAWQGTVRMDGA